jgi:hypothetical protein
MCGRLVLELAGQDFHLDPVMLPRDGSGRIAVDTHSYGACHLVCLAKSDLCGLWHAGLTEHFAGRATGSEQVGDTNVFYHVVSRQVRVVGPPGFVVTLRRDELERAVSAVVPVSSVMGEDAGAFREELNEVAPDLWKQGRIPLSTLIDRLGLEPYLIDPAGVVGGEVRLETVRLGKGRKAERTPVVAAHHRVILTPEVYEAAVRLVRSAGQ